MSLDFDFKGIEKRLQTLSKKASKETIDKALEAGEEVILDEMRKNVPKDTWDLHNSLGELRKSGSGLNRKAIVGINSDNRDIIERGYYQEYGHSRMTGKKWMKAAERQSKVDAVKAVANSLSEQLKG